MKSHTLLQRPLPKVEDLSVNLSWMDPHYRWSTAEADWFVQQPAAVGPEEKMLLQTLEEYQMYPNHSIGMEIAMLEERSSCRLLHSETVIQMSPQIPEISQQAPSDKSTPKPVRAEQRI